MTVTITIHCDNANEALAELMGLSAGVSATAAPHQLTAEPVPDDERKVFPPETKPKRAPKGPKVVELEEVAVETANQPAADVQNAAPEPEKAADVQEIAPATDKPEFSEDDVRKALVDLGSQANGKENCRAVLMQFGATKISEVKADDRKSFIAAIAKLRGVA